MSHDAVVSWQMGAVVACWPQPVRLPPEPSRRLSTDARSPRQRCACNSSDTRISCRDIISPLISVGCKGEQFVKAGRVAPRESLSPRFIWMAAKEIDEFATQPTTFIESDGTSLGGAQDRGNTVAWTTRSGPSPRVRSIRTTWRPSMPSPPSSGSRAKSISARTRPSGGAGSPPRARSSRGSTATKPG